MDTQSTTRELSSLLKLRVQNIQETRVLLAQTPGFPPFIEQLAELEAEEVKIRAALWSLEPKIVLAVDPAMRRSGMAFRSSTGTLCYGYLDGIHNLTAGNTLKIARAHQPGPNCPIYAMVEYPTWKGKGTDQVRAAANCWISALKSAFPRRVRVRKVNPQTWMAAMIPGYRRVERPAELYIPLACQLADSRIPMDENAAAAIVIRDYAEAILRSGQWAVAKPVLAVAR